MPEIPKQYNPKDTEDKWFNFWLEKRFFSAKIEHDKNSFSIVIPPPNVTGILHMGHALNNTFQDILIRYHRMKGDVSLWMPGIDHAGIATQNVVEKAIAKEGLKRQDLGREKFIERVWAWKEQYGSTIIKQLKKLGSSCDWDRLRFTMDEDYSKAVIEVFIRLYEKGLIYRGNRIINWCPRCQTALSDEEAPHQDIDSKLYYLKYPLKDNSKEFLVVATTRPETMLGDSAVAVNPKDKRYKKIIGKKLILPLINREIEIIADKSIDMNFGTGAVKVTPAHDPNDYALGKIYNLSFINVMHPDARMNENAGKFNNLDRFKARELIIEELKTLGLLEKIEPHKLSAGHCYRCHTIIEPYLSKQWFVRMVPLAKPAIEAVKKGKIKFYPERWTKVYLNWMENIQDWCISRQIWWGHRIPVYYCNNCLEKNSHNDNNTGIIVSRDKLDRCPHCGSIDINQDEDVLDTWFSSWLWPFATFYWPKERSVDDLKYFYPTKTLVTAPEIIFFWVARMIMAGFEFMGKLPFKDVYIHGTVRDLTGKKMSKSLGNVIDPLQMIEKFGTDALRFSLINITSTGQDVFLSEDKFQSGRNFANKIWNASRFVQMNLKSDVNKDLCISVKNNKLSLPNRWIVSQFYQTLSRLEEGLENYNFNAASDLLYDFFWHKYCDWYLELIKPEINGPDTQLIMYKTLEKFLRILHPFMPFITEEIWQKIPHEGESIMITSWPHMNKELFDFEADGQMERIIEIISSIRNLKSLINLKEDNKGEVLVVCGKEGKQFVELNSSYIEKLSGIEKIIIADKKISGKNSLSAVACGMQLFLKLEGLIDIEKERNRIKEELSKLKNNLSQKEARLNNKDFVDKAPIEVINKEKDLINKINEEITRWEKVYNEIC